MGHPAGWAVTRDVLLVGPWRHDSARSGTHRRVPGDHSAERVLLRTVGCLQGAVTSPGPDPVPGPRR